MAFEDFTTFIEIDQRLTITVATNKITVAPLDRDDESYVYIDKGAGYFGNFEHFIDCEEGGGVTDHASILYFWGVSNDIDDSRNWTNGLATYVNWNGTLGQLNVRLLDRFNANSDTWTGGAKATRYYFAVQRAGTTATLKIYSDASHTILLDTFSITCETTQYQYLYGCSAHNSANNGFVFYGYIYNLDLQEAPPPSGGAMQPMKHWGP